VILAEPPGSQGDVHFRLFGIPIRIHPFFWIVALILGIQGDQVPPATVLIWIASLLLSITVHELGHALMQRRYGGRPRIVLYGMGGLAICDDCDRSSRAQILISFAGPGAGFLLAILLLVVLRALGHQAGVSLGKLQPIEAVNLDGIYMLGTSFYWKLLPSNSATDMIKNLLWINVMWGAVNLLPIYPLDGGQISRELCLLGQPRRGMMLSLQISIVAAVAMAIVGLSWGSFFVILMFGYLAYSSYRALEAYRSSL
jgi:stage IV sporulation protein FB